MTTENLHPADQTLLLYADDELSPKAIRQVCDHLEICAHCSARLQKMKGTLAEFAQTRRQLLGPELPSATGPRAALRSRLERLSRASSRHSLRRNSWARWVKSAVTPGRQGYVLAGIVLVVVVMVAIFRREIQSGSQQLSASLGLWTEPRTNLTPGLTLPLTRAQVCAAASGRDPAVPVSLQRKVLAMYGVSGKPPDAYEVDYLITPELGGATDVRNLWPEPYYDTAWNAHVKNQLEDRLHLLVCEGDVDLATAQQDISKDWIAAYRKYFHTDQPLTGKNSSHNL